MIFLIVLSVIVGYLAMCGVTHGYGKHHWPPSMVQRYTFSDPEDEKEFFPRVIASMFWPFYWVFVWPVTKASEVTFDRVEKRAAMRIAKNKIRIADLRATKKQLAASNAEMEAAEVEVEKEMAKL